MPEITPDESKPSLERVGAEILRRTKDNRTNVLGTFTNKTTPTDAVAQIHIDSAARDIALQIGNAITNWTGSIPESALDVVATEAALRIERSSPMPDSVIVRSLEEQAKTSLDALLTTVRGNQPGGRRHWSAVNKTN